MRRTIVLTQEELDDIDDNKWRRKSYALAQHNALPVPMPLPVYPPPKPCPPPPPPAPAVCRPSRPGARPQRPGYRPLPGYRPSSGYHPSKTANPLPAMPEVLPALSEIGSAGNSRTSSPLPPRVSPSPQGKGSSPAPPKTSTFKSVDSQPVQTTPEGPTSQRMDPLSGQTNPPSRPTDPPPLPAHLLPPHTNPPAPYANPNSALINPPPLPTKPPPLPTKPPPSLKRPPSSQKTQSPQTNPISAQNKPPTPTAQLNLGSLQADPGLSQAENPPPQTVSPSLQTNPLPESSHCQKQTDPTSSGHPDAPPVMADDPSPAEMTPTYSQTSHSLTPQSDLSPTESNPVSAQTDPSPAIHSEESRQSTPTDHPPTRTEPSPTQTNHSPEQTSLPVTEIESFSPMASHCPPSRAHDPPVRTDSPSTQSSPRPVPTNPPSTGRDPQPPEINPPQINPRETHADPLLIHPEDPLHIQTGLPETEIIPSLTSDSPTLGNLPPTPTSQHFPPTPTSLSRSTTPTSLGCPRTPTSIRAAPWQPFYPPTPLSRSSRTTPTPPTPATSPTPSAGTPRPVVAADGQVCPPTPPSSSSTHVGVDGVTPASSMSSLNHVAAQTKAAMDAGVVQYAPDAGGDAPGTPPYPAVLDVASLRSDVALKGVAENGDAVAVVEKEEEEVATTTTTTAVVSASGKEPPSEERYATYWTRFWVLALFSSIAFLQTIVWGTFGPIAESAIAAFPSWTEATIAAFPNWGPIIVVVFTIPIMWLTEKLGLRLGVLTCAILLTTGTLLRCFPSQELPFTILCHVGAIFFAFAACMTLSLPAMVAAIWFPPNERITATAVGALMCQLGGAALYLEPLVVRYPSENPTDEEIQDIRGDIKKLMYIHFGAAAFLLLATAVYFPARPDSPPSASSAKEKINFFTGIKNIVKNPQLLLVLATYSFSFGVPVVWIGVLNLSLIEIGIHQEQSMGVAVTAVVCSAVAAFITARVTDKVYGHLRFTIMALLILSSVFFLWFLLISTEVITPTLGQVYASVTGGVCFEYATVPLLVELAVETGYPIPESVTGAALTLLFNLVALVFLGLFQIPQSTHLWVSYVLFACVSLTLLPLIFVKETHKRSDTDRKYIQRES